MFLFLFLMLVKHLLNKSEGMNEEKLMFEFFHY